MLDVLMIALSSDSSLPAWPTWLAVSDSSGTIGPRFLESVSDVNAITRHPYEDHEDHKEELVAAACRLVGSDTGVRSVRVLIPSRPTYDELFCYQEWGHDQHARLTVDGEGVITVRPGAESGRLAASATGEIAASLIGIVLLVSRTTH